jgi:hypothetical protein
MEKLSDDCSGGVNSATCFVWAWGVFHKDKPATFLCGKKQLLFHNMNAKILPSNLDFNLEGRYAG